MYHIIPPHLVAGFYILRRHKMETRIAIVSIIVEDPDVVEKLNAIIHDYRKYIIGRMGIPYQKYNISVISIVMDAPNDIISAFSGKLGMLKNVTTKTAYSKPVNVDVKDKTSKD
jgi:putative iron-only hydrogenase system regulator